MTQGLRTLQPHELSAALEELLLPRLIALLRTREPGHCMRVGDLDLDLMKRLCVRLQAELAATEATVVILRNGVSLATPPGLAVSSTKLVELRNPLPDGSQRPPLLVFIPTGIRASAEDSFGVATFEEIAFEGVYDELVEQLLEELPLTIRGAIQTALQRLDDWPFADPSSIVRFLLTAKVNGGTPEVLGACLYELGLVPDFDLLAPPEHAPLRIAKNRACVEKLTWSSRSPRGRVLDLELANRGFRSQLGAYLAETGTEDPRGWTRGIVLDRNHWPLAFNHWEFDDAPEIDSVFIGDVATNLPQVPEDESDPNLSELIGQRILPLGKGGLRKFNVTFRTDPHPSRVQGLQKFTVQIISKEHGPVGLVRGKSVWKSSKPTANVSFSRLSKIDWEEGWHFARVLALTEDGELIPLVDEAGAPLPWGSQDDAPVVRPNESDLFYVIPGGKVEVDPPQRAVQREASVMHAWLRLQFTARLDQRDPSRITPEDVSWAVAKRKGSGANTVMLEAKFGREGAVNVPVSRPLKVLEQRILREPSGPISWRVMVMHGSPSEATGETGRWPKGEEAEHFLAAREAYFEQVRAGSKELITQGANLIALRPLVVAYAETYTALIAALLQRAGAGEPEATRQAVTDLRRMTALDTVRMVIRDHRGVKRTAVLVAPTHPLRALWLATWAELGQQWLRDSTDAAQEFIVSTRDALLQLLTPTAFPPVLPLDDNGLARLHTAVDNLNPFWSLFAPSSEEDPRSLVGDVCAALGLPEPAIGGAVIDGKYLASRVQRYLLQHPYVRTLVLNAFKPGRASVLADMLLALQKDPALADIHYDVRLFVPDAEDPGVGEALTDLLQRRSGTAGREAEAFSTPGRSHLDPKLALAVRPISEFRDAPEQHPAHLTLLFDVFPAEEVGADRASAREASAPIHGLVQDFQTLYREDQDAVAWERQPRHGVARSLDGAEELTDLLSALPGLLSNAAATIATGQTGLDQRPVITLALSAEDRVLLHQVHEVSDWVLTMDRNLGIEFFDHGGTKKHRPDYLIDHSPDVTGSGHRLVITSRSVTELEAMLKPVLAAYNLNTSAEHAVAILGQLRSLSGRLALKLISAPTQRAEALGLALSRMFLEHQGVFENQVVVPLDAHLELYSALKKSADELGDEVSFKRTDLALFDLNAAERTITCRLVEVKCYNEVGDLAAFGALKEHIATQIAQSEHVIAHHFDPKRNAIDRPDRLMKTRELATLLEFYLDRSVRYGIMAEDSADEARFFIRALEHGYELRFTRSALIFDFAKPGTEPPDVENGIEYHRIGSDLISQLVDAAVEESRSEAQLQQDQLGLFERSVAELKRRRERAPSIPTLADAAFVSERRERSVSWDELSKAAMPAVSRADTPEIAKTPVAPAHNEQRGDQLEEEPSSVPPRDTAVDESADAPVEGIPTPPATQQVQPSPEPDQEEPPAGESETAEPEEPVQAPGVRPSPQAPASVPGSTAPAYDALVGVTSASPQYGILGEVSGRKVAIDLNHTHTISLFGVQGGGKSYTLGTVAEMASLPIPNINKLPQPLATVIFHYSPTMDYKPEFTSMVSPNGDEGQLAVLRERYGAEPRALTDVLLLVPADKLDERRAEYPGIEVRPLKFAASELQASHWRFLMGAVGNQATYIRQLNRIMKRLRDNLTLAGVRKGVDDSPMPDHIKALAHERLEFAGDFIDDETRLGDFIHPGRLIIVDVRDEFIEKDQALGLFVVLLQLFADAKHEGKAFNKLVVFDEAHKYIESPDLVAGLVEVVREMRHKGTSIMVASQDPPSVPVSLIELSSQIILHKFNSPAWLKHIQKANAALGSLTPDKMAHLRPGEAYLWSSKATDDAFCKGAIKVKCRPRVTQHGGATKTAVDG